MIMVVAFMLTRHLFLVTVEAPRTSLERDVMAYTAELRRDPDDAVAHAGLGIAYMKMGRSSEALSEFRVVVRLEPKNPQYRYNLAVAYLDADGLKRALSELDKAQALAPDWDVPFFASGRIHLDQADYKKAVRDLIVSLEIDPQNADAHFSLATAYEALGRTTKAAAEYRETLKYVPDYKGARAGLKKLEKK